MLAPPFFIGAPHSERAAETSDLLALAESGSVGKSFTLVFVALNHVVNWTVLQHTTVT